MRKNEGNRGNGSLFNEEVTFRRTLHMKGFYCRKECDLLWATILMKRPLWLPEGIK